jgi:hypothetical protein
MADKKIGVYRVPGAPNPWEQDDPPWLEGWDTVGPAQAAGLRLPMWTERDLGIGQPRPGYYQTVADGLGALLRECGRMHEAGNTSRYVVGVDFATGPDRTVTTIFDAETGKATDKWRGPWEWDATLCRLSNPKLIMLEACDHGDGPTVWCRGLGRAPSLAVAVAYIRGLSSDPVPDPPAEVWELCGEDMPSGWAPVVDGAWAGAGCWKIGKTIYSAQRIAQGRECVDGLCARDRLPPLPDEAFKAKPADDYTRPLLWTGRKLRGPDGELAAVLYLQGPHVVWSANFDSSDDAEYTSTTAALLAIREAFPDAPPCPPEIIREVMAARGEVPDAG